MPISIHFIPLCLPLTKVAVFSSHYMLFLKPTFKNIGHWSWRAGLVVKSTDSIYRIQVQFSAPKRELTTIPNSSFQRSDATSISHGHFLCLVHSYTGSQNTHTHKTQINKHFLSVHTTLRLSWPCRLEDKCSVFRMLSLTVKFFFREIPLESALNPIHVLVSSYDPTISTYSKDFDTRTQNQVEKIRLCCLENLSQFFFYCWNKPKSNLGWGRVSLT